MLECCWKFVYAFPRWILQSDSESDSSECICWLVPCAAYGCWALQRCLWCTLQWLLWNAVGLFGISVERSCIIHQQCCTCSHLGCTWSISSESISNERAGIAAVLELVLWRRNGKFAAETPGGEQIRQACPCAGYLGNVVILAGFVSSRIECKLRCGVARMPSIPAACRCWCAGIHSSSQCRGHALGGHRAHGGYHAFGGYHALGIRGGQATSFGRVSWVVMKALLVFFMPMAVL
mmetsp:Transcript_145356/g.256272  ORF Transcript_145356/g.256272 Transcript_145356/m.256272 type:complete len:235 (-) Transcript_145356:107-811(-)